MILGIWHWVPRYDCITLVAFLIGIFWLLDKSAPRDRNLALHASTQILLWSFLIHLWTIGYEGRNAVFGGIIPWSDSFDFYDDALRLVHGDRFTEHSSKRPIFSTAFAGLLRISGGDLRFALVACAIAGGSAIAFATNAIWKSHGARSAFVVYFILLCFERRWTGFIQTEHAGLPLGAIGFVLFWRANTCAIEDPKRARKLALVGIFAIATGLMARAGAFFVLPALGIWGARTLVTGERPFFARLRFLILAGVISMGGFALHKGVLAMTGTGVTFSDYPGIAYGLIHGEDYTFLGQTHPEIRDLAVGERVPAAWRIVTSDAAAHPGMVATGLLQSGAGLFVSPFGMFSYVWTNPDDHVLENAATVKASMAEHGLIGPLVLWRRTLGTYSLLNAGAMGGLSVAFVLMTAWSTFALFFTKRRKRPELSLQRHAIAGVIISAPFTPPWITSGMQVQTVTLAFVASLCAVVVFSRPRESSENEIERDRVVWAPFAFAAALFAIAAWMRLAPARPPSCEADHAHIYEPYPSTAVVVSRARHASFGPIAEDDLKWSIKFLAKHNPELTDSFVPYLHEGTTYVAAFDACERRAKLLVDDGHLLDASARTFRPIATTPLASPKLLHVVDQRPVLP